MLFSIQQTLPSDTLFIGEEPPEEEEEQKIFSSQGTLKTSSKCHFCEKQTVSKELGSFLERLKGAVEKKFSPSSKTDFFSLVKSSLTPHASKSQLPVFFAAKEAPGTSRPSLQSLEKPTLTTRQETPLTSPSSKNTFVAKSTPDSTPSAAKAEKNTSSVKESCKTSQERSSKETLTAGMPALYERRWTQEETLPWWEARYQRQDKDKEGQHQEQEEEESGKISLDSQKAVTSSALVKRGEKRQKPQLAPPKLGIFALYYILTKIGIFSDGASTFANKKEIEILDVETTETHQKRLKEMQVSIEKERSSSRWGITVQMFSWMGSLFGIISGVTLIITGVGAVAGAMLIAGGVIQITSQILQITGGWSKIADLLPCGTSEQKRAAISWMQIGIGVLCLILSGAGAVWGGFSNFGEGMAIASRMIGGIAMMGGGIATIGQGISGFMFKNTLAEVSRYDWLLAQLKHRRQDLMEKMEEGIDHLEKLFEDLANSLEFDVEIHKADQMINRR